MKKIIISIATISVFIFTSCFTDSDTATVKINLGNIPVAEVEKKSIIDRFLMFFAKEAVAQPFGVTVVHLGAFDANNELLASQRISSNNYPENNIIEFDVPAGIRRKIVVLGEIQVEPDDESQIFIGYHGVSDKEINLIAGEVKPVEIKMNELHGNFINLTGGSTNPPQTPATWDRVPGASRYNIYKNIDDSYVTYVTDNSFSNDFVGGDFNLSVYFDFAKRESQHFYFEIC